MIIYDPNLITSLGVPEALYNFPSHPTNNLLSPPPPPPPTVI